MATQKIRMATRETVGVSGRDLATKRPALKAKEVVEVERAPEGVRIIRKIVVVDAKTEKFVRNLCLPCDEEWYKELCGDDCVCKKDISIVDEIMLPLGANVAKWL